MEKEQKEITNQQHNLYRDMTDIERLKMFYCKPPLFAEQRLEELKMELWDLKMNIPLPFYVKRPKDKMLIKITQRQIEKLQREIFIDSL